jgi:hypothetical protein
MNQHIRTMFRSKATEREYEDKGFAVLTMPDTSTITTLNAIFRNNCGQPCADGFYYSLMGDAAANILLKTLLAEILAPVYDQWFSNYESAAESFLMKGGQYDKEMGLHQDWCYVDEEINSPATLWVPLQEVDEQNGCMFFLPGSHLTHTGLRSGSYLTSRISAMGRLASLVEAVPLEFGQAVAFHPAVFHGSYPNRSGQPRRVMGAMMRPAGSPLLYYHRADGQTAEVFGITERTLLTELHPLHLGNRPAEGLLIGTRPYVHQCPDEADLLGLEG